MASKEIEVLDSAATVQSLKKTKSRRALSRRKFMTALGAAGAATSALLTGRNGGRPSIVSAATPAQSDVLNFALNLEFLEATFYSYITQGVDLPPSVTVGSGAITGAPTAKLVFTGANAAQITDMLNEIYYDELNHVIDLRGVLGALAIYRPAINLAAAAVITATNALSIARVFEDVGVTAYTGAASLLTGTNLTYAAQILAVEGFHAGALRLTAIQNPTIAAYAPTNAVTFTAVVTQGSNIIIGTASTTVAFATLTIGWFIGGTGTFLTTSGIPAKTTITGFSSVTVGTVITVTITLSANAVAPATSPTGTATTLISTDPLDLMPADPGTAVITGPTVATGGFFATSGPQTVNGVTPAGLAFTRTTSQVLQIVYATAGAPPIVGSAKGGFFPNGLNGAINTI